MKRLSVREGEPIEMDSHTTQAIRRRLIALESELMPRLGFVRGDNAQPVVQNLVGSVQVSHDLVLDIEPKTEPGQDWAHAVVDLLVNEPVAFEAYTTEAEKTHRNILPDAFARLYVNQLDRALRREGPLAVLVPEHAVRPRLAGRLDVTRWVTSSLTRPHMFPQRRTVLTVDNDYTSAMAWVCEALAVRCSDPSVGSRLRSVAARLRPGLPAHTTVDPGVALRPIPPQWRAYEPAWLTACAVLTRISPVHRSGFLEGLGLAVEPWPLLETLLHRSLHAAAALGIEEGLPLRAQGHSRHELLTPEPGNDDAALRRMHRIHTRRGVEPDGSLWSDGTLLATFEAKYVVPNRKNTRQHIFQAMTTAGALDSPLVVLVYPEPSEPVVWMTHGFDGRPARLIAVGLDMFAYRRGPGDRERGRVLLKIVKEATLGALAAAPAP